jgi:flagellar biosynthetic protein FliQ
MDSGTVIEHTLRALWMCFLLCGPILIAILAVGLAIGIVQAATSINESSVAFIPKLVVLGIVIAIFGPYSISAYVDYLRNVIIELPNLTR